MYDDDDENVKKLLGEKWMMMTIMTTIMTTTIMMMMMRTLRSCSVRSGGEIQSDRPIYHGKLKDLVDGEDDEDVVVDDDQELGTIFGIFVFLKFPQKVLLSRSGTCRSEYGTTTPFVMPDKR